jgi:hypothetical protein
MPKKVQKVPVSMRALIQRINRKLAKDYQRVGRKRGGTWYQSNETQEYFLLDVYQNRVLDTDLDPEWFGRKIGVLQPWEEVIE